MPENDPSILAASVDSRLQRANDVLAELCRAIVQTEDAAGVARDAAIRLQRYFATASVGLWWVEGDRLRLEGLALSDRCKPSLDDRIREEYGLSARSSGLPGARAVEERRVLRFSVASPKLQADVRSVLRAADADSLVCIPIYVDGDPVGVGLVAAPREQPLTAVDESLLESALGVLGIVYQRARLQERDEERRRRALHAYQLAMVGELAAGVAHEVNNPLSAIAGLAEILAGRDDLPDGVRDDVTVMRDESLRAGDALRQLLAFAPRKDPEEWAPVDLPSVVESVVLLHARRNELAGVDLEVRTGEDVPPVEGRRSELQQMVHNLITNARRMVHEREGGKGRIVIRVEETGDRVELTIRDTGPGIRPGLLEHIFDPFFSTREGEEATGLGLATVHEVVRDHGGTVTAENWGVPSVVGGDPGEGGARFRIRLPLVEGEGPLADRPPHKPGHGYASVADSRSGSTDSPAGASGPAPLVLVVEDDEPVATSVRRLLEQLEYRVRTAGTAEEALDLLDRGLDPAVILSDVRMPGMGGAGLHREISEQWPELVDRLIYTSGDLVSPDTRRFLQGTDRPVLPKPFRLKALRDLVDAVANRRTRI